MVDNNGYIILSDDSDDTGRFFGEVQGRAMQELVRLKVFKAITVYDYQAVCKVEKGGPNSKSFATILITVSYKPQHFQIPWIFQFSLSLLCLKPFQILKTSLQWICMEIVFTLARLNVWAWAEPSKMRFLYFHLQSLI